MAEPAPDTRARGPTGLGQRLAAYRAARGLKVTQLAREVGVSSSLISQIERQQSQPSVSTLFALAEALDVPVDAFFEEGHAAAAKGPPGAAAAAAAKGPPGAAAPPAAGAAERSTGPTAGAAERSTGPTAGAAERSTGPAMGAAEGSAGPAMGAAEEATARPAGAAGGAADGETGPSERYVVRRGVRSTLDIEGGIRWERLTPLPLDRMDFLEIVYEPRSESHPQLYRHPGTEMLLVLEGRLDIHIGFRRHELVAGDSMHFPSSLPHRYVNPTDEEARAVTVLLHEQYH